MPKRKKIVSSKSYLDTLVSPDHRLERSFAPIVSADFRNSLEAALQRLEAAWPHVGPVGVARDRVKASPIWAAEVATGAETESAGEGA